MELIATLKGLRNNLPQYGLEQELEQALSEYLLFLQDRQDLLELAETYHNDIYETGRYTPAAVAKLPPAFGWGTTLTISAPGTAARSVIIARFRCSQHWIAR